MSSPYDVLMPEPQQFRRVIMATHRIDGAFRLTFDDIIWTAEVIVAGEIKIRIMGRQPGSVLDNVLSQIDLLSQQAE